jgi:hypothetical protein
MFQTAIRSVVTRCAVRTAVLSRNTACANVVGRATFASVMPRRCFSSDELTFAESHEWFRASDGAIGISGFAADELGEVVYVGTCNIYELYIVCVAVSL